MFLLLQVETDTLKVPPRAGQFLPLPSPPQQGPESRMSTESLVQLAQQGRTQEAEVHSVSTGCKSAAVSYVGQRLPGPAGPACRPPVPQGI